MPQNVPDIEFNHWVIAKLPELFANNEIFINADYQRSNSWKISQKQELICSINSTYPIGIIVLFRNDNGKFEIMDGQQRLITLRSYLDGTLDLSNSDIIPYAKLDVQAKTKLNAYCVYFIRLKSYRSEDKEEVIQIFLRLQEGTPLNKAEKLSASIGKFKDAFLEAREHHKIFSSLGPEKRFRWRQLAAEMLALELEGDYNKMTFPDLGLHSMKNIAKTYEKNIPKKKIDAFNANLDFLFNSLHVLLTAFDSREYIAFYLLASFLRKRKAGNSNLINEFSEFTTEFLNNVEQVPMYSSVHPKGMNKKIADLYLNYKAQSKIMTTSDSLRKRLEIMLNEYDRLNRIILKDPNRLFDAGQKRTLYFRQKGLCGYCGKLMVFKATTGHHIVPHSEGGETSDLGKSVLLDEHSHKKIEQQIKKGKTPFFLFKGI